ncbi:MAG: hypothetical protein RMY29_025365 [Nostoc sp. CreGUA01]
MVSNQTSRGSRGDKCSMPHAPCPIPHAPCPMPNDINIQPKK